MDNNTSDLKLPDGLKKLKLIRQTAWFGNCIICEKDSATPFCDLCKIQESPLRKELLDNNLSLVPLKRY